MVTIKDIAKRAGISYATVSRALNNRFDVNEATRQQVLALADEMGYRPNAIARSLVTKRTSTIAVIVPDISNPFFSEIIVAINNAAEENGYTAIVCNTNWSHQNEIEKINFMKEKCVDGIILKSSRPITGEILKEFTTPVVLLAQNSEDCSYVDVDSKLGGYLATKHLLDKGKKHICVVSGVDSSPSARERVEGHKKALSEYGMEIHDEYFHWGQYTIESGHDIMQDILKNPPKFGVDAVVCGNDIIALGVLNSLRENEIDVPSQISVIGYDDISYAGLPQIMLSTISMPLAEIGTEAFNILCKQMDSKNNKFTKIMLEPKLKERKTT